MTPRSGPSARRGAALGLGVWALLAALHAAGVFVIPDLALLDAQYRLRGEQRAADRIALIAVDDATVSGYGRWPLPRETYAVLLAALDAAGARAVGFDLLFLGDDEADRDGDRLLAGVSSVAGGVVHAMALVADDPALGGGAATAPHQEALLMRFGLPVAGRWPVAATRVSLPYDALLAATAGLGHVSVAVDPDGVVRRVPAFVRYGERVYASLGFQLAIAARADTAPPRLEAHPGRITLRWPDGGRLVVPVDAEGATAIRFAGDRDAFPGAHSMIEVLRRSRDGDTAWIARSFRDRLVLVGATAQAEVATDIGATPFSAATPLLYVHANALDSALRERFLRRPALAPVLAALAAIAALLGRGSATLRLPHGLALAAGTVAGLGAAGFLAFAWGGWVAPGTLLLLLAPAVGAAVEIDRRVASDRAARVRGREMQVARSIQRRLLPAAPPDAPGFDVWGLNLPAQDVGGDYYDWLRPAAGGLAVCVGDVSGKGVSAALLMSHLHASFHAESRGAPTPRGVVEAMHASLHAATEPGRFATFFLAHLDDHGGLRYCNAGHNPALLVTREGLRLLEATGLPLAMFETSPYQEAACRFERGDVLVLYSDGVVEAERSDRVMDTERRKQLYGDDRLREVALRAIRAGRGAREIVDDVLADVRGFTRGALDADDLTIVVVRAR